MASQTDNNEDILRRLEKLERAIFASGTSAPARGGKTPSLPEIIRGREIRNGQEKIAAIVGYLEKIRGQEAVSMADMRAGWREAKFDGGFAGILVTRAVKHGLISNYGSKGSYVLTQTGEDFWERLLA